MNDFLKTKNLVQNEIESNCKPDYKLGNCLYLGMAYKNEKKVCISVGYTISYSIKKADQFLNLDKELSFSHISKINTGEKVACKKFYPEKPFKQYYK